MERLVRIGPHVRVLADDAEGIDLEGRVKLMPGRRVSLVLETGHVRPATVWTWWLRRVGRQGAEYCGRCRWE